MMWDITVTMVVLHWFGDKKRRKCCVGWHLRRLHVVWAAHPVFFFRVSLSLLVFHTTAVLFGVQELHGYFRVLHALNKVIINRILP